MIVSSIPQINNRKKVLILGNGFDLDLGRKTLYKDFYLSDYCPKDYPAPLIKHLNEKWTDNLEAVKWYDLENELFNYYDYMHRYGKMDVYDGIEKEYIENYKSFPPFITLKPSQQKIVLELIERRLLVCPHSNAYLSLFNEDLLLPSEKRDTIALSHIKKGLVDYLLEEQKKDINIKSVAAIVAKTFAQDETTFNKSVYSFNYTDVNNISSNRITSRKIEFEISYVHGNANENNIILGTKDGDYDDDYVFLQKSFDINYNPPTIVYDLMEADEVIIFGHSLGKNDNQYFKAFFEKQSTPTSPIKKKITIFTKDEKSEIAIKRSLNEMTNYNLTSLYSLNDLCIIKTDDFYNRKITGGDIINRLN